MDADLEDLVWQRAGSCCEYCQLPQGFSRIPFELDHVIACKHFGKTIASNLALSCYYDNSFKGSNIASLDPRSGRLTRLFHPRRHSWNYHFRWDGPYLIGRTAIGRCTVRVLLMNLELRVVHRQLLIEACVFPPVRRDN